MPLTIKAEPGEEIATYTDKFGDSFSIVFPIDSLVPKPFVYFSKEGPQAEAVQIEREDVPRLIEAMRGWYERGEAK